MKDKHFDQHIHSSFSFDAEWQATIARILETAIDKGLDGIAVADHFDPLWPEEDIPSFDLSGYEKALLDAEILASDRIRFIKGVELGLLPGEDLDMCHEAVGLFPYDFVIGSVHYSETTPIDYPPFLEGRTVEAIIDEYYTLLLDSINAYKDYDVIGHINHIDRYTDGLAPEELYMPYVDEILKIAVQDGKGLEINTSSFRYGIGERGTPTLPILTRFRELGGEIITIGSDAHSLSHVGAFIEEGESMLLAAGFRYLAVFKERQPEYIKL